MKTSVPLCLTGALLAGTILTTAPLHAEAQDAQDLWVTYPGDEEMHNGAQLPGVGKHIVFVTGDEEYRSEEAMPMLAQILAERHGFTCTVLFAVDPESGDINPELQTNIPGLQLLADADLMFLVTRFRELPDADMAHILEYTNSGKPIIGLRTASHPFHYKRNPDGPYAKYDWRSDAPGFEGGYGRQVFGETWVNHHGDHGTEATRGLVNGLLKDHPIANGIEDIWGPTDVYGIRDLPADAQVVVYGQVLQGMDLDSPPNYDKPVMPIAWMRDYPIPGTSRTSRVFFSTIGAAVDLESEGLRRLLVNATYWATGMEDQIPDRANVEYVAPYDPSYFGFGKHRKGVKPADLKAW